MSKQYQGKVTPKVNGVTTKQPNLESLAELAAPAVRSQRRVGNSHPSTHADVAQLQRTVGNQGLGRLANRAYMLIQTKPTMDSLNNAFPKAAGHTKLSIWADQDIQQKVAQNFKRQNPRHSIQCDGRQVAPDQIANLDIQYEVVAHDMAYKDLNKSDAEVKRYNDLLRRWGYLPGWAQQIDDSSTSFFVGLIMPDPAQRAQKPNLHPVLAFRGSIDLWDFLVSDTEPEGVGYDQFKANVRRIRSLLRFAGRQVDATGHSLGGALAQRAAVEFPSQIARVITFQSPGIARRDVNRLRSQQQHPQAIHHIAQGDLVDFAGESNIPGTVYEHNVVTDSAWMGRGPVAHQDRLLNTPEYQNRRRDLGIADNLQPHSYNVGPTMQYGSYPHPNRRSFVVEPVRTNGRKILVGAAVTIAGGGAPGIAVDGYAAYSGTREYVFHDLAQNIVRNPSYAERLPLLIRIRAVHELITGPTTNTAENAILTILRVSQKNGDLVQVIDRIGVWNIVKDTDGDEYIFLKNILRQHYYNQASPDRIFAALRQCMDGVTWEWEQEMIADILTQRPDGRNLIERIGQVYHHGGFAEGWQEVMDQVDGDEKWRLRIIYEKI